MYVHWVRFLGFCRSTSKRFTTSSTESMYRLEIVCMMISNLLWGLQPNRLWGLQPTCEPPSNIFWPMLFIHVPLCLKVQQCLSKKTKTTFNKVYQTIIKTSPSLFPFLEPPSPSYPRVGSWVSKSTCSPTLFVWCHGWGELGILSPLYGMSLRKLRQLWGGWMSLWVFLGGEDNSDSSVTQWHFQLSLIVSWRTSHLQTLVFVIHQDGYEEGVGVD